MNTLINKNKLIYFFLISLLIGMLSALNWKVAVLIFLVCIFFIVYITLPYKVHVLGVILLYPYTDFINEKISIFKIGLSLYIIALFLSIIMQ